MIRPQGAIDYERFLQLLTLRVGRKRRVVNMKGEMFDRVARRIAVETKLDYETHREKIDKYARAMIMYTMGKDKKGLFK